MLLGILSDSHGHVRPVQRALGLFDQMGVEAVIHCGDVGEEEVFQEFVGRRFWFVWGNTDLPTSELFAFISTAGLSVPLEPPLRLDLDGKRIAVFHGHEPGFSLECRQSNMDYILHGHTHERRDEIVRGHRIINPGALHRTREKTVATLDLAADVLTFHAV